MYRLHEAQQDFIDYVFQETSSLGLGIIANGLLPEQRLSIYRNNTYLGLMEALKTSYPVIYKLVGDAFFKRLTKAYVAHYPLRSPCLMDYGAHFSDIFAIFKEARSLAYLTDTARLEWLWHEAYHEADVLPLNIAALAKIDVSEHEKLSFKLHPTARFIASHYPIAHIWQANQSDTPQTELIDLINEPGCQLLIYRPVLEVVIVNLPAADYLCLTKLASGLSLTKAVEIVMAKHPSFDIQHLLQYGMLNHLLTDFFINTEN